MLEGFLLLLYLLLLLSQQLIHFPVDIPASKQEECQQAQHENYGNGNRDLHCIFTKRPLIAILPYSLLLPEERLLLLEIITCCQRQDPFVRFIIEEAVRIIFIKLVILQCP